MLVKRKLKIIKIYTFNQQIFTEYTLHARHWSLALALWQQAKRAKQT